MRSGVHVLSFNAFRYCWTSASRYHRNASLLTQSSCSSEPTTSSDIDSESESSPIPTVTTPHPIVAIFGPLYGPQDFDILESLGEGFFSFVHKVRVRKTDELLVLKVSKGGIARRLEHLAIAHEVAMLRSLQHPNIISLRGICVERYRDLWDIHILTEYCSGGSLQSLILDHSRVLQWPERASYAIDVASAMEYLHSKKVIHRDLTSMNILLQRSLHEFSWDRAIVSDFGLSCEFPQNGEILPQVGTTYYMSPECLNEEFYDERSDIFSFGIILCQLIARIDADPEAGMYRTGGFGLNYVLFASYCPPDTPLLFLKLAFTCCLMNPALRPSFSKICGELARMNLLRPPSPESWRRMLSGERLLRSDSYFRRTPSVRTRTSLRKVHVRPQHVAHSIRPLAEGVPAEFAPVDVRITAVEQLARGFLPDKKVLEEGSSSTNPFLVRFRERKLLGTPRDLRRRSETKHEECSNELRFRFLLRRCCSLPSDVDVAAGRASSAPEAATGPGEIPMAFREVDKKFIEVKSMKRFLSRRYTLGSVRCAEIKEHNDSSYLSSARIGHSHLPISMVSSADSNQIDGVPSFNSTPSNLHFHIDNSSLYDSAGNTLSLTPKSESPILDRSFRRASFSSCTSSTSQRCAIL